MGVIDPDASLSIPRRGTNHRKGLAMDDDKLEDMGWTPEEAAMMRRIDPAVRDRVLNLLARVNGDLGFLAVPRVSNIRQTQLGASEAP